VELRAVINAVAEEKGIAKRGTRPLEMGAEIISMTGDTVHRVVGRLQVGVDERFEVGVARVVAQEGRPSGQVAS